MRGHAQKEYGQKRNTHRGEHSRTHTRAHTQEKRKKRTEYKERKTKTNATEDRTRRTPRREKKETESVLRRLGTCVCRMTIYKNKRTQEGKEKNHKRRQMKW